MADLATLLLIVTLAASPSGDEQPAALERPVPVKLVTRDGETIHGDAVAFDLTSVVVRGQREAGEAAAEDRLVAWADVFAPIAYSTYRSLMDTTDARGWLALGEMLRTLPDGAEVSDSALSVAAMLDEELADEVEAARAVEPPGPAPAEPEAGPGPGHAHTHATPAMVLGDLSAPTTDVVGAQPPLRTGPLEAVSFTWDQLSPLEQDAHVADAKAFADEVAAKLGVRFTPYETRYFLYYTTLPPQAVYQSPAILDQMYDKASDLYRIPRGVNIFKGKCLVFMFATQDEFKAYVKHFGGHEWAAGFCQQAGTGEVRIVMFQGKDRGYTTQTMLHETQHGVNWRYRRPMVMPAWIEEGVAEWVAANTTGNFYYVNTKKRIGAQHLKETRRLGPGLLGEGIRETWEYGVAYDMVSGLINRDRDKFVRFINRIKDGQPWEWALQEVYNMTVPELVSRYGQSIGVPDLQQ